MKSFIFVLQYEMKAKCDHRSKFTAMITLHFHLIPQYKYELFHIYFIQFCHCSSITTGMNIRKGSLGILSCRPHFHYANPTVDFDLNEFFKDTRSSAAHMHVGSSVSANTGTLLLQDCDTKTGINNRTMSNSPSKQRNKQTNSIGFI